MSIGGVYRKLSPLVAACFYYSGLVPLLRWQQRRSRHRLIVLNYHHADGNLRRHLLYLRQHYRVVPLQAALEELYTSPIDQPPTADRRTAIALTFDDGYYDNYTHAYALACELHVPITIFLPPGYIGSSGTFAWLEGEYLAAHAQAVEATIAGRAYHLERQGERKRLAHAINFRARHAHSISERDTFLASVRTTLGVPECTSRAQAPTSPLAWSNVEEMDASEWVTFGAHTMHHPVLTSIEDPDEVRHEIVDSRRVMEQRLGHPVCIFAYPYGAQGDIDSRSLQAVREAGFKWALTTIPGFNTQHTDPHLLRRMPADASESSLILAAEATGMWTLLLGLLMRALGIPVDTGALPYFPLFKYRWRERIRLISALCSRHSVRRELPPGATSRSIPKVGTMPLDVSAAAGIHAAQRSKATSQIGV